MGLVWDNGTLQVWHGSALRLPLENETVDTCITSPPYWGLREYAGVEPETWPDGWYGRLGDEPAPDLYVAHILAVMREVWRVLKPTGTLWINLGDSYAGDPGNGRGGEGQRSLTGGVPHRSGREKSGSGLKPKDLAGIPWRVALALRAVRWYLRSDIIWHKPNTQPESVTDRPTGAHEYIFLLTKAERYYYNADAIREPAVGQNEHDLTGQGSRAPGQTPQNGNRKRAGKNALRGQRTLRERGRVDIDVKSYHPAGRNKRSVWTVATEPYPEAHFATFPEALIEPCILAGAPPGGVVLDPFSGSGTTGKAAQRLGRRAVLVDASLKYCRMTVRRLRLPLFDPEPIDGAASLQHPLM